MPGAWLGWHRRVTRHHARSNGCTGAFPAGRLPFLGFVLSTSSFTSSLSALSEKQAKEFPDIKEDQRRDAVRPELCALRLPNRRLSPHKNLHAYQLSSGLPLPAARPSARATLKVTACVTDRGE